MPSDLSTCESNSNVQIIHIVTNKCRDFTIEISSYGGKLSFSDASGGNTAEDIYHQDRIPEQTFLTGFDNITKYLLKNYPSEWIIKIKNSSFMFVSKDEQANIIKCYKSNRTIEIE